MNTSARFAEIKSRLHKNGLRPGRWPEHLNSKKTAEGFLRVVLFEDDDRIEVIRFNEHEFVLWDLSLSIHLPAAVFDAALNAACAEAGGIRRYKASLNGKQTLVTIPEN